MEQRNVAFRNALAELESNHNFSILLRNATSQDGIEACTKLLIGFLNASGAPLALCVREDLFNLFLTFCGTKGNLNYVGPNIRQAIRHRQEQKAIRLSYHRKVVRTVGLDWKSQRQTTARNSRFIQARKIHAHMLDNPYPPRGHWVIEHPDILNLWKEYLTSGKRHDKRTPRPPIHILDFEQLDASIRPDESAIVYDKDTHECVLVVYREICPVPELIEKADSVTVDAVDILKNVRVGTTVFIEYDSYPDLVCAVG